MNEKEYYLRQRIRELQAKVYSHNKKEYTKYVACFAIGLLLGWVFL